MRILRKPEVLQITGLSYSQIYQLEKIGMFPKRMLIGLRAIGWLDEDIESWIKSRVDLPLPSFPKKKPKKRSASKRK